MYSTKTLPLNDEYFERDIHGANLEAEGTSSNKVHRLRPSRPFRSTGRKNLQFRNSGASLSKRQTRSLARFFFPLFIGVVGTLAWWSYGDDAKEMLRTRAPSLGWLLPATTMEVPAPAVTSVELQQQIKPVALDVAIARRSLEQLAFIQEQLARKQEQMTQAIAALQAAQQDMSQKILATPSPKTVHVPPPKPLQPAAQ